MSTIFSDNVQAISFYVLTRPRQSLTYLSWTYQNITSFIFLIMMMIAKTNAVLEGVTSFLKYGTLDSSNSDVSRAGSAKHNSSSVWVAYLGCQNSQRIVPGLWVAEIGCQKGLGCPEAGKYNMLSWLLSVVFLADCRTTKTTLKTGWLIFYQQEVDGWIGPHLHMFSLGCPKSLVRGCNNSWFSLLNIFCAGERPAETECAVRQHERHQPGENSSPMKTKSVNNHQSFTSLFHSALAFHNLTKKLGFIFYVCPLGGHQGSTSKSVPQFKTHQVYFLPVRDVPW